MSAQAQAQETLVFENRLAHERRFLAATDASQSFIVEGIDNPYPGLTDPITVVVQAVDTDGNRQTSGGDTFMLRVEQKCNVDITNTYFCIEDPDQSNVAGLPLFIEMTDNGDGTY